MKHLAIRCFAIFFMIQLVACAQKRELKNQRLTAILIKASLQKTLPGRQEGKIEKQYSFIIKWQSSVAPAVFYFKDNDSWYQCNAIEADYKGDTLLLQTYPVTAAPPIEASAKNNTLIFRTIKSDWLYLRVLSIESMPDIIMP